MIKKLQQTVLLLIIISGLSFPQWSTDPNDNLIIGYGLNPELCSDSAGGCYVTYEYGTTAYPRKLALERIDKYGYKPWGIKKQILGELPEQWQAEIIEDGQGGVIISYEDDEWIPPYYFTNRIRVQRVDSSGNMLWGQTGVRATLSETNHGVGDFAADGGGGCVVVWLDTLNIYKVNHINSLGQRVWGDSGKVLGIYANDATPRILRASDGCYYTQTGIYTYRIRQNGEITIWDSNTALGISVPDSEGGIVLSGRVWIGNIPKLVAQRKDSLGNNLWQEPYMEIADSLWMNTQINIQENNGYYYYTWTGKKNGIDRIAQFQALRSNGSKLFDEGSKALSSEIAYSKMGIIVSDPSNTIFCWNVTQDDSNSFCQMYDTLGNKILGQNEVVVSHPDILYQTFSTDGNGGFIIGGVIDNFTVVVQQVSRNGNLGEIITTVNSDEEEIIPTETVLYQNYPNPFNSTTVIEYHLQQEGRVELGIYNILGEKVLTVFKGEKQAGKHRIVFSSGELPSGTYFCKLSTGSTSEVKKLILLK